ncbi:MAG: PA0069 family radical SAM protein [Alphaproteobacteria bacterium]|nr:PA0069 family radical SAM protein [Alphaproteobacteria bacterium]
MSKIRKSAAPHTQQLKDEVHPDLPPDDLEDRVADNAAGLVHADRRRGRGARSNRSSRFDGDQRYEFDDGWESLGNMEAMQTTVHEDRSRSILTRNDSPDISFDQSINPYRGCEHGCIYCYARPSHCYLGHSAGVDFETQLYVKPDAAKLLEKELGHPRYKVSTIALGSNTDPYQPIERQQKITRAILEVLERVRHPVAVVTKSALVTRDIDLLSRMAQQGLAKVAISITTLDRKLARAMEPRASTPAKRLAALRELHEAGIPTAVMVAPIIPGLTDAEIESILEAAAKAGAQEAGYVMLRLPLEIKELFREWLEDAAPNRAKRVINLLQSMHEGQDYRSEFNLRQRGSGPYAAQIAARFRLALKRYNFQQQRVQLRHDLFKRPIPVGGQMPLL